MSDFIHQAFGIYQLNECLAFLLWIYGHTIGLIPVGKIIHYMNHFGWWSLCFYIPAGCFIFTWLYWLGDVLIKNYKALLCFFFTYKRPNKFYFKRLPLLVTPRIKYISQYRGDTQVMTWNLFTFAILLMLAIYWIPIPVGKLMLYVLLLGLLAIYASQIWHYGYMRIVLILSGLIFAHCMLYFNIHFSFIILPHEKLFNFIPMNPSDYAIDISRIYFSLIVLVSYIALLRVIFNVLRWSFLQDKKTATALYKRNDTRFAFGLLKITELTSEELKLWDTQREHFEKIFMFWPLFIVYFCFLSFCAALYLILYMPFKCVGKIASLQKFNKTGGEILSLLDFKPNRFLAPWRLDASFDGVTRTENKINETLNNTLVGIREGMYANEDELKNSLLKAFPDFESRDAIDSDDPQEQHKKLKEAVVIKYDNTALPGVLAELGCSAESIKVILQKYTPMHISKAIHQANQTDNKTSTLFQHLEHS